MKPGRLHRALHQAGIMAHPEARDALVTISPLP